MLDLRLQDTSTIDLAIEQHYLDILQLKHQRNAICRNNQALPSELLEEVFQHYIGSMCRADHKPLHDRHEALSEPYAWIRICRVCHPWRGIALASPRIWSRIVVTDTTKYECIREMLSRSQQAPLVVKVHAKVDAVCMSRSVQAILAQMHRICSMDLRIVGISLLDHIQAIECNAPLLRALSMSAGLNSGLSVAAVLLPTGPVGVQNRANSTFNLPFHQELISLYISSLLLGVAAGGIEGNNPSRNPQIAFTGSSFHATIRHASY
ncbi:hypothetical protein PHLCEN_2v11832 [Hermanssonia centrifuga]|uniref:Uncharacterized protein n=1 Tax=Hermanssonia centrifuga TaxID=98765 RepID=A0A2R6NIP5_9APHY|nr:hypothetical protein PHLCEN_2v11832 [Hermanssonia centrifuga]